jgi:hypothetical protein
MFSFSNDDQIGFRHNIKLHERSNQNIALKKNGNRSRNQTILYCNDLGWAKIWNFNSTIQKYLNWTMHCFYKF